jgi:membrane protein
MKALIAGLNVAYEEPERRGFLRLNLLSLALTVGAIVCSVLTIAAGVAAPVVLSRFGFRGLPAGQTLHWAALFAIAVAVLSLLYRCAPSRPRAPWRWTTPGGFLAAAAWMGMSGLFSIYVGAFGHFDRTYGSLGAVFGFMTWIWLSLIVVLLGAELNSELEQQSLGAAAARAAPPNT